MKHRVNSKQKAPGSCFRAQKKLIINSSDSIYYPDLIICLNDLINPVIVNTRVTHGNVDDMAHKDENTGDYNDFGQLVNFSKGEDATRSLPPI